MGVQNVWDLTLILEISGFLIDWTSILKSFDSYGIDFLMNLNIIFGKENLTSYKLILEFMIDHISSK